MWINLLKRVSRISKDHRGTTLIELLVAIGVGAIVLSGIAGIIVFSMTMFSKNNAKADLQNEIQDTLNYVTDMIMQADGIAISYDSTSQTTECVLFGKLIYNETEHAWLYNGVAFVADTETEKAAYLIEFPNADYVERPDGFCKMNGTTQGAVLTEVRSYVLSNSEVRKSGLLANYLTKCYIHVKDDTTAYRSVVDEVVGGLPVLQYVQPFSLAVELKFEKETGTGIVTKTAHDSAAVRNQIGTIYVNGSNYDPLLKRE